VAQKVISKPEAKKQGLKTYYTGKPCPRGHYAPRYVNSDKCIECHGERNKRRKRGKAGKTAPARAGAALVPINSEPISGEVISGEYWRFYADRIAATWQKATGSIIETGALLLEAKDKVEHGEFEEMIERESPFGPRAARMLMDIARNPILSDRNHGSVLPPSWRTLYELTRVPADVLIAKIEDHTINPEMERKDVKVIAASVTATTAVRRTKAKRRDGPTLLDENVALIDEIKDLKAHIAELEAAREADAFIDADDEPTLARKIVMVIGKERAALLIAELQKLIAAPKAAA
jgi:hypothetical protein